VGTAFYFYFSDSGQNSKCLAPSEVTVTKIIDGDTIIVEGGHHIRLLGIDADERGGECHDEAKKYLEGSILNKEVILEKDISDIDQYDRCLRYVFRNNDNINIELVERGLAVARFYNPDVKYKEEITQAEQNAKESNKGCKWSKKKSEEEIKENNEPKQWNELTTSKLGYDVVDACEAGKYLGRELIIQDKVVDSYHDLESNTVFLNFGKAYPDHCFTVIIFGSNLHKFVQNPEDYYLNKEVRIMGEVKEYKGEPEIILETPNQIEVGK